MIQRIQTIYLVLSLVLVALIFVIPIANVTYNNEQFVTFRVTGFYDNASETTSVQTLFVVILVSILICLLGLTIFLYKRRIMQARLCIINIALLAGLEAFIVYNIIYFTKRVPGVNWSPGLSLVFPLIAIILTWLASKAIRKDEKLVRESDRLR